MHLIASYVIQQNPDFSGGIFGGNLHPLYTCYRQISCRHHVIDRYRHSQDQAHRCRAEAARRWRPVPAAET
ncbi:protein of unknown function [Stenotrophomonas maltophilia]|nr:protein of unknown function [Stenotrophomonas maltophilia]